MNFKDVVIKDFILQKIKLYKYITVKQLAELMELHPTYMAKRLKELNIKLNHKHKHYNDVKDVIDAVTTILILKPITVKYIAEKANLTTQVVSKVIREHPELKEEIKKWNALLLHYQNEEQKRKEFIKQKVLNKESK